MSIHGFGVCGFGAARSATHRACRCDVDGSCQQSGPARITSRTERCGIARDELVHRGFSVATGSELTNEFPALGAIHRHIAGVRTAE